MSSFCFNLAGNSRRPVALGRKNWIHIGTAGRCIAHCGRSFTFAHRSGVIEVWSALIRGRATHGRPPNRA